MIIIIIVMIIIIIVIVMLKVAVQDCFTVSLLHRELFPTRMLKWPRRNHAQVRCNILSAYHVQPAIMFDRADITFILALFELLKPLIDEGGEETGVPGENPWWQASENATYSSPKIQAPSETRTHRWQARKADVLTITSPQLMDS